MGRGFLQEAIPQCRPLLALAGVASARPKERTGVALSVRGYDFSSDGPVWAEAVAGICLRRLANGGAT